ncbi:MAG: hypothetical protein ACLSAH_15360 [Bilophila wadsworthia]
MSASGTSPSPRARRGSGFADVARHRVRGGERLVSITNGSGKTVTGVRLMGAYREGRSTNIAKGTGSTTITSSIHGDGVGLLEGPGLTRDPEGRQGGLEGQHHQAGVR